MIRSNSFSMGFSVRAVNVYCECELNTKIPLDRWTDTVTYTRSGVGGHKRQRNDVHLYHLENYIAFMHRTRPVIGDLQLIKVCSEQSLW